jgi:hypothetical protein
MPLFTETVEYLSEAQKRVDAIPPFPELPPEPAKPPTVVDPETALHAEKRRHQKRLGLLPPAEQARRRAESVEAGLAGLEAISADKHERIAQLVPIAQQLARESEATGQPGIPRADVRAYCEERGLLTENAPGRSLSWLGSVMRAAGLVNTGQFRRSHIKRSQGVPQSVWRLPDAK